MRRTLEQSVVDPTYLEFFGLSQPPFARLADPSQLFHSEQYSVLMEHLANATTNNDSLVVVCGADGSGKTTLLNRFVTSVDDQIFCAAINETCQSEEQFYIAFLTQIGFAEITGTASELQNITKKFLVCRGFVGDHILIIIDNAHLTDPTVLEQVRRLCEIKIKDRRVLSVVLAGNADIVRVVDAPAMRQTKFRNHVVFGIRNYSEEETTSYVWHRLRSAGDNNGVKFSNEVSSLIHRYSGGTPHLINVLCNEMLAEACSLESRVITEEIVRTVANKQQLLPHVIPLHGKARRKTDPDFKHVRAVPETASFDTDNLLQQIARLSAQIGDLQADKTRTLQDIDARNNDIIVLRDELDSQTTEVEKLTHSLATDADEITQQNLALSDGAIALQDSEERSKKLAADLEKEIRAREAAQNELAEATGTVEQLSELKQELQATVDDVQADLKAAGERATESDADEKSTADLKDEIEGKAGELDSLRDELASRNEALADLEMRLEESQAKYDSAQLRIAALKNPEELEEIEKASDKLATNLRKETRARKAAENELAKATATVEELSQLKQELQATVDDVQADLTAGLKVADERAVEIEVFEKNTADLKDEIEGKTGKLDSLRDELASRNEILADLEVRLDQSQRACELAQLRIVALKSPKELDEIEKASDKLAADLENETRARKAVENELAEATATVEELSELKQELQATVDDVQVDLTAGLKVADERAVEIEVFEKNTAHLKDEIEGKAGELDSLRDELALRNEALADLEMRLEESQAKYDSAQLRIAALKNPEELEKIEEASDKLAADLRQESRARKAAQKELAKATATAAELSSLKHELQATVDDVRSDLRVGLKAADQRAVKIGVLERETADLKDEIEGKAGEIDSLRDELASRNRDVADLESWLEESKKESTSAQLRIATLKSPEELEEVKKASGKLAAELEQEIVAREAVDNELEKATATVEELNQLKQGLQATVRDLNADLAVVGERAIDAYVLERNVTDLKDVVEKITRELDSRNQALADLEKQLEASQNESEVLRGRGPAVGVDEDFIAEESVTASTGDARVYSSNVVAMFEQSIRGVPAFKTLREYDPVFYDGLISTYKKLVGQDLTDKQVSDALRFEQVELMEKLLPRASDDAIIAYGRLIVDQLDELQLDGTEPCLTLMVPQSNPNSDTSPIYSEHTKERELDALDITLRTYDAERQSPAEEDVWPDLGPVFSGLIDAFGSENVAALQNSYDPNIDRVLVCNVSRALYSGILNFPKRNAANALRWLLST